MRNSLTARVIVGAVIWIVLALGVGGYAVYDVFRHSALRQFDARLEEELSLLKVAIAFAPENVAARMASPAFGRSYSGLYWQASEDNGPTQRSRSLQGWPLPVPTETTIVRAAAQGPDGQSLRWLGSQVEAPDGTVWTVSVAQDTSVLTEETAQFRKGLLLAAALLAVALIGAAFMLLRTALSPLKSLRDAVRDLHRNSTVPDDRTFPTEVAPLIADLNDAFDKNLRLRERGRVQAANLAHALKTPAAILGNEIDRAAAGGKLDLPTARSAVDRIAKAAEAHLRAADSVADLTTRRERIDASAQSRDLVAALGRLYPVTQFDLKAPPEMAVAIDAADLHEILGNFLENAGKWAKSRVVVTLAESDDRFRITVDDDGPGVPEAQRQRILGQGIRLDETKSGSGLGLAIVDEIVERYDGNLSLKTSRLGGLRAEVSLPSRS